MTQRYGNPRAVLLDAIRRAQATVVPTAVLYLIISLYEIASGERAGAVWIVLVGAAVVAVHLCGPLPAPSRIPFRAGAVSAVVVTMALVAGDVVPEGVQATVSSLAVCILFLLIFSSMVSVSVRLDLVWSTARWQSSRWSVLLLLLAAVTGAEPRVLRVIATAVTLDYPSAAPVQEIITLLAFGLVLVLVYFCLTATSNEITPNDRDGRSTHRSRAFSQIRLDASDEAVVLVTLGNSGWAIGALLGSVPLFNLGGALVVAGFGLNADLQRDAPSPLVRWARWMRAANRQLLILAGIFLAWLLATRQAPPGLPHVVALVVIATVAASLVLSPEELTRRTSRHSVDRTQRSAGQRASPRWGITLGIAGWALLGIGVGVFADAMFDSIKSVPPGTTLDRLGTGVAVVDWSEAARRQVQILAGIMLAVSGTHCRMLSRRLLAPIVAVGDREPGSFVLYLRPFDDDARLAGLESWPRSRAAALPQLWFHELVLCGRSEEEHLVDILKSSGTRTVLAVGAPGDWRPPGGATRVYLDDRDWKSGVLDLLPRARLVVMVLGHGEGTRWELIQAMRILPPERLLLIVAMPQEEYEPLRHSINADLRSAAEEQLRRSGEVWMPPELPEFPRYRVPMRTHLQAIVVFDDSWTPIAHPLGRDRYPTFFDTLRLPLKAVLYPFFGNLRAFEGAGFADHLRRAKALAIAGGGLAAVALTVQLAALAQFAAGALRGDVTAWSSVPWLPWWLHLAAVAYSPWLTYCGRTLRCWAYYFAAADPATSTDSEV